MSNKAGIRPPPPPPPPPYKLEGRNLTKLLQPREWKDNDISNMIYLNNLFSQHSNNRSIPRR